MNKTTVRRIRLLTRWCAAVDGILLDRNAAGTSPVKLILVQCHADVTRDSKGDAVCAGLRVVAELRTGGRLCLFATGGRLVERGRPDEALPPLLDERDVVEREALERDDDGVPCERVPRCELSEPLMAIPPPQLLFDQIHPVAIQYEPQHRNQLCPPWQLLQPQHLLEFQQYEFQNSERDP